MLGRTAECGVGGQKTSQTSSLHPTDMLYIYVYICNYISAARKGNASLAPFPWQVVCPQETRTRERTLAPAAKICGFGVRAVHRAVVHLLSLVFSLSFLAQDLDHVRMHLEEVRFFDLFGYSEAAGAWQCFMCNNPEKATGERAVLGAGGLRRAGAVGDRIHRTV